MRCVVRCLTAVTADEYDLSTRQARLLLLVLLSARPKSCEAPATSTKQVPGRKVVPGCRSAAALFCVVPENCRAPAFLVRGRKVRVGTQDQPAPPAQSGRSECVWRRPNDSLATHPKLKSNVTKEKYRWSVLTSVNVYVCSNQDATQNGRRYAWCFTELRCCYNCP